MPQVEKPTGFFGKILARGMAWGHRSFYKNTAKVLDLQPDDRYLRLDSVKGYSLKNMLPMLQE